MKYFPDCYRKAMVTDIAERLNLKLSADKELRQCKQRVSEIENLYASCMRT